MKHSEARKLLTDMRDGLVELQGQARAETLERQKALVLEHPWVFGERGIKLVELLNKLIKKHQIAPGDFMNMMTIIDLSMALLRARYAEKGGTFPLPDASWFQGWEPETQPGDLELPPEVMAMQRSVEAMAQLGQQLVQMKQVLAQLEQDAGGKRRASKGKKSHGKSVSSSH